jgi:hypothetical protein
MQESYRKGMRAVPLQDTQQTRREFWMGSIVEGEGSDGLLCCDIRDGSQYMPRYGPIQSAKHFHAVPPDHILLSCLQQGRALGKD